MTIIEAGGLYEVARWQNAPGSFTAIDALLGFRYWNNTADLNFNIIGSVDVASLGIERGRTFSIARTAQSRLGRSADRASGCATSSRPASTLMVRGDVGGFGLASQFAWQAVAVYSYSWQFSGYGLGGLIGYRALGVSYVSGTGINTNGVDVGAPRPARRLQHQVLKEDDMPGPITVFSARKIITMDAAVEEATHVAVRDGIIIEVGDLDDCAAWGPTRSTIASPAAS